jgi:hypothetical protein
MYKIIGADGREYGPVSAAQLRQWIAERRANAQTQIQVQGSSDWISLGSLTEFADVLAAAVPPPRMAVPYEKPWTGDILSLDYQIKIGECIGKAWDLVTGNFWFLVGAGFIAGLIAAGFFIPYLGALISLVIFGPITGGLYALYLKKIRGQSASLEDMFVGFGPAFGSLLGAHVVSSLLTIVGFVCCILPGIYLATSWVFTLPLVIDRGMDFWSAMELSRKVVAKHWWKMFGFMIVLGLLGVAGVLACVVGICVTLVISQIALIYAYEKIFNPRDEPVVVIP